MCHKINNSHVGKYTIDGWYGIGQVNTNLLWILCGTHLESSRRCNAKLQPMLHRGGDQWYPVWETQGTRVDVGFLRENVSFSYSKLGFGRSKKKLPKWWFDGYLPCDLPWYKVKSHLTQIQVNEHRWLQDIIQFYGIIPTKIMRFAMGGMLVYRSVVNRRIWRRFIFRQKYDALDSPAQKSSGTHWKFNSSPLKMDGWKTTYLLGG